MSVFKLTEKVWWGDMRGPIDVKGEYKSILDVSGIYTADNQHYRLSQIDPDVAVFRLMANEDVPASPEFGRMLYCIHKTLETGGLFPLLVHCMAGQCRAPITAAFMAWLHVQTTEEAERLLARVLELGQQHGVDQRRAYFPSLKNQMLLFSGRGD